VRRTFFNPPEAAGDCAMLFNILHAQDPVATPGRPYRFAPLSLRYHCSEVTRCDWSAGRCDSAKPPRATRTVR
jgi:hypothetical protein